MSQENQFRTLVDYVEQKRPYICKNRDLFEIYEGELLKFIKKEIERQFSGQTRAEVASRAAPINVLKRIVDKLSRIYQEPPTRIIEYGSDVDKELLDSYEKSFRIDEIMNVGNEFFNLFKTTLVQPYVHKGIPKLRSIPSDRFVVYSDDPIDDMSMTHLIILEGKVKEVTGEIVEIYKVYTDDEFYIIDSKANLRTDFMAQQGNPNGVNIYGKIPFVYVNQSHNLLMPIQDSDTYALTILLPILLSDLNFCVKYQAFSILFGIDVDDENLQLSPNSFWRFKSEGNGEQKPQVGQIKPQCDIDQVLGLIQSEFAFWLNSRGIRTSAVGEVTTSNFSSGISKLIDEMDTYEITKKQIEYFTNAEKQLWNLVMHHMHPVWVNDKMVDTNALFSPTSEVNVRFLDLVPMVRRADLIKELKEEVAAGFTTRKRAIGSLNPKMTEDEVDVLFDEIEEERFGRAPQIQDNEEEDLDGQES